MNVEWFNLMPIPTALGMVVYVNYCLEKHRKNCSIHEKIEELHKDIREIRKHQMR